MLYTHFQDLARLIPDIGSSRVQEVPAYNGSRDSTRIMMATRSKLDQMESPAHASGKLDNSHSSECNIDSMFAAYMHP